VKKLGLEANIQINYSSLVMKVIDQLYDKIPTTKIDELTAEQCAVMSTQHPDYAVLAGRVVVSNHQKNTDASFYKVMEKLYWYNDVHGKQSPLLSHETWMVISANQDELEGMIDYNRDYLIDYFGFKTLERAYLFKVNDVVVERPQHMWLRVAVGIHGNNMDAVRETYDLMSQKYFTHATPTLFNAGTPRPQLSSCYLIAMEDDSVDGIYDTLKDCAKISKWAGGIGLHIHNIRAKGTRIRGTNGKSNGIVPMLRVFNNTAKFIDQGGGRRNGSFAIYLETWHADIEDFLDMRKNHGDEELRARDLFYALWVSDLFMERVKENGKWSLFCPHECPGLADVYGDEFKELYMKYEGQTTSARVVNARELWFKILDAQMETGTPYLLYKDAANIKSNQKNIGTIKSSNLCVAPETKILTDQGDIEIQRLLGKKVNVWNGEEFSEVEVFKTGENQELIDVYTSDGCKLTCTKYHKFFIQKSSSIEIVRSSDLSIGDTIIEWKNIDNTIHSSVKIEKIVDEGRIDDTYCFNESKRHCGIFNGIITSQCTEILEYSDDKETAVCNLASIALPAFVNQETKEFNYEELHRVTKVVTGNLNRIIDINFYPTEKTKRSNMLHRPIGIGVQGLADVFIMMDIPFHSEEAKEVNKMIFETIYHAALEKSNDVAISRKELVKHIRSKLSPEDIEKIRQTLKLEQTITDYSLLSSILSQLFYNNAGSQNVVVAEILNIKERELCGSYSSFEGSPASKGQLQFDLWGVDPATTRYNWSELRECIQKHGLRNSLLVAPMPTASTSQILGYNECFEPLTSNLYTRRTLAGEFVVANKYLMKDLISLGLWNEKIKNNIIANKGSIQQLNVLPEHIREKYKIVWEMPMKHLIDMAADRGAFICQSQSLNLWLEDPNYNTLTSMHFYSWKKGLKTGIYYLRRKAKHQAQQFTLEPDKKEHGTENDEICEMCSA
jgi:ribonucleotide reductase alpha subunit